MEVGYRISHFIEESVIKRRTKRRKCFRFGGINNSLEFWEKEKHGHRTVKHFGNIDHPNKSIFSGGQSWNPDWNRLRQD